jgi:hypothetical protein
VAAIHVATAAEGQVPPGRLPKRCKFADVLNCASLHPPWRCGAFGDKKPEERAKIIEDNKLCPICLLHDKSEVCYSKIYKTKPECTEAGCEGQHIQWLHELLKDTTQVKTEGKVNVVQGQEGWRTPDKAWMEGGEEEEEVLFVNIVQVEEMDSAEELVEEIGRTEEAIDNRYRRRAKRAGIELGEIESAPLSEEERDKLSERLGDREGVRAKKRKEIEEMQLETMEAEVGEVERTLASNIWSKQVRAHSACPDHCVLDGRAGKRLHSLRLLQQEQLDRVVFTAGTRCVHKHRQGR